MKKETREIFFFPVPNDIAVGPEYKMGRFPFQMDRIFSVIMNLLKSDQGFRKRLKMIRGFLSQTFGGRKSIYQSWLTPIYTFIVSSVNRG